MERHRCKLCFKNFANGKALGGHMRSHMLNLYVPPKSEQPNEPFGDETELDSVSSSSEEEDDDKCLFGYGLRENPKKSMRLVDPEFSSFHGAHDHQAVILQDRESETESTENPVRRRSKRFRKLGNCDQQVGLRKPCKLVKLNSQTELASWVDTEPVSSISDTSPEEDVAYCLMMLSRDKWRREKEVVVVVEDDEQEREEDYYEQSDDNESDHEEVKVSKPSRSRAKYKCDTCNKVFKSYQALGGHRASHKKIRLNNSSNNINNAAAPGSIQEEDRENAGVAEEKIHECPVCFRVFASGQALGGHKRSHAIGSSATIVATSIANNTRLVHAKPVAKQAEMTMIDLNLPAPMEDADEDEISQIELSAVSDGEFVKPH